MGRHPGASCAPCTTLPQQQFRTLAWNQHQPFQPGETLALLPASMHGPAGAAALCLMMLGGLNAVNASLVR